MKRLVCSFLAFMLLLSLLPLTFQVAATDVVWSGSGDEVRANITINNTKSYTLEYDLHLPGIGTGTNNNTFADDVMLKIRQTTADHYIIFRVKSYRNAEGKFQIQGQQQFYDGNWSAEFTEWSDNMDAPVSDIHVHIAFDTAALTYTWALSDRNGSRLCGGFRSQVFRDYSSVGTSAGSAVFLARGFLVVFFNVLAIFDGFFVFF